MPGPITLQTEPVAIEILEGDIAAQTTDAIVNAANNHFWMGAGVAGAIKARGGQIIEREAMAQGPVTPGQCVITSAGSLPARYVIHAAVMGQDLQTSGEIIDRAVRATLTMAARHGLESIAIPALGTGVGGFPIEECARVMVRAVRDHAAQPTPLKLVRFVLFGPAAHDAFARSAALP